MNTVKIAWRNVRGQARRTVLLALAIGFGFFIITMINGLSNGAFESVTKNFATLFGGQLYVSGSEISDLGSELDVIRNVDALTQSLGSIQREIVSFNKRSMAQGTLIFGSEEQRVSVIGVDFDREAEFFKTQKILSGSVEGFGVSSLGVQQTGSDGSAPQAGEGSQGSTRSLDGEGSRAGDLLLMIPQTTAEKLGILAGERAVLRVNTISGQANVADVTIAAISESSSGFGISGGFMNRSSLNELLGMSPEQFQSLNIYVKNQSMLEFTAIRLHAALKKLAPVTDRSLLGSLAGAPPGPAGAGGMARMMGIGAADRIAEADRWQGTKFTVSTLNDNLSQVASILAVLNGAGLVVFLIILAITMIGITNSYRMVLLERTGEIGTMRAMGFQRGGVAGIFLLEALMIAGLAALGGLLLGGITSMILSAIPIEGGFGIGLFLDGGRIAYSLGVGQVILNVLLLMGTSALAVSFPARRAAKLKPADALRAVA